MRASGTHVPLPMGLSQVCSPFRILEKGSSGHFMVEFRGWVWGKVIMVRLRIEVRLSG